jgi:hypothetical protein
VSPARVATTPYLCTTASSCLHSSLASCVPLELSLRTAEIRADDSVHERGGEPLRVAREAGGDRHEDTLVDGGEEQDGEEDEAHADGP